MSHWKSIARELYARKPRKAGRGGAGERESILIVDDDTEVIEALRQILQDRYEVVVCSSYAEVGKCRTEDIRVVLLDVKMAPKDGAEIFSLLRQRSKKVRIIFNTAYPGESAAVAKLRSLDSDGYLTKGEYSAVELNEMIERAMRHSSSPAGLG